MIGEKMRRHVIQLSCDRFGCHVMQKAVDKLDQNLVISLIDALLESIPDTITHPFSCHVWQRIFEVKWLNSPPPIMKSVQNSLFGQWAQIANDESGSLVVQCILEHCNEIDKAPIVTEIFVCTLDIARGQWGNWVIQHLLDHGTASDQHHIMQIVLENAALMSIDQYASKVVEKCVKGMSKKNLLRFIEIITEVPSDGRFHNANPSNPPILRMMNHQYGNYVLQNVLGISEPQQRNSCVKMLIPHLNVLRGSKYGQRVSAICEKHAKQRVY